MRRFWPLWLAVLIVVGALIVRALTAGPPAGDTSGPSNSQSFDARGPQLTEEDAKAALVGMLREEANRDVKRCREVWGSEEPDRLVAAVPIMKNSQGDPRIGAFDVNLGKSIYRFWAGGGTLWYEGSFIWKDGLWQATEPRLIGKGCIIGQGRRRPGTGSNSQ